MTEHTVTRAELSEAVYQEVGLSRNESADLVESILNEDPSATRLLHHIDAIRREVSEMVNEVLQAEDPDIEAILAQFDETAAELHAEFLE